MVALCHCLSVHLCSVVVFVLCVVVFVHIIIVLVVCVITITMDMLCASLYVLLLL